MGTGSGHDEELYQHLQIKLLHCTIASFSECSKTRVKLGAQYDGDEKDVPWSLLFGHSLNAGGDPTISTAHKL